MRTWSYTIMGNSQANIFFARFNDIVDNALSDIEKETLREISDERNKELIEQTYEDLVRLAIKQKSRLAYQVLGVYLMKFGAKMTNALKELILINSNWDDEKDQLFDEKDKAERFYYLSEFREAIKNYKEGVKTKITWESNNQVVKKLREQGKINDDYPFIIAPDRIPIRHDIKNTVKNQKEIDVDWIVKLILPQDVLEGDRFRREELQKTKVQKKFS